MLKKLYTAAVTIGLIGLASCAGNNDKSYVDKSIVPTDSQNTSGAQPISVDPALNPANAVVPNTVNPGAFTVTPGANTQQININPQTTAINAVQQPNKVTATQQAFQPAAAGMNPAHGQPGHRCDIAVGAPLNSPPAANNTAQPANNVSIVEQPAQKTAPGMNPPHGEPGHRCDIAVGAPLNSKPAPPPATNASAITAVPPLLAPVKPDSSKN